MGRPIKIEYPGAWHYVRSSVMPEREVFKYSDYRKLYLVLLEEMVLQFGMEVHAYVLLDQCSHLLLRSPQANMAKSLSWINSVFTQRVNRNSELTGPVFKGRYRSVLFDESHYLAELSRYIHLLQGAADNVVQPKSLSSLSRSSVAYYLGQQTPPSWLTTSQVLSSINKQLENRSFRQFMLQGNCPEVARFYAKSRIDPIMGGAFFKKQVEKHFYDFYENIGDNVSDNKNLKNPKVIKQVAALLQLPEAYLKQKPLPRQTDYKNEQLKENRKLAVFLCRAIGGLSAKEIAAEFSLGHYSAVSRIISEINIRMKNDPNFANKIYNLLNKKIVNS